jgi:hypothetical protein
VLIELMLGVLLEGVMTGGVEVAGVVVPTIWTGPGPQCQPNQPFAPTERVLVAVLVAIVLEARWPPSPKKPIRAMQGARSIAPNFAVNIILRSVIDE